MAENTLREYNTLLKTQLKSLESDIFRTIDQVTPPGIAMRNSRIKRTEQLEQLIDNDTHTLKRMADSIHEAIRDLNDPKLRTQAVNDIVSMTEQCREMDDFNDMLAEVFGR